MGISSLFSMFGRQRELYADSGFGNLFNQFNQFKQSFQGNPQQEVQRLLDTGQMTQQQFNQLSKAATQFQNMMKGRF